MLGVGTEKFYFASYGLLLLVLHEIVSNFRGGLIALWVGKLC